jgi:hypothetical protein
MHHIVKMYAGVEVLRHAFLFSALRAGEWVVLCCGRIRPGERVPNIDWTGADVGRSVLGAEGNLRSHSGNRNSGIQSTDSHCAD